MEGAPPEEWRARCDSSAGLMWCLHEFDRNQVEVKIPNGLMIWHDGMIWQTRMEMLTNKVGMLDDNNAKISIGTVWISPTRMGTSMCLPCRPSFSWVSPALNPPIKSFESIWPMLGKTWCSSVRHTQMSRNQIWNVNFRLDFAKTTSCLSSFQEAEARVPERTFFTNNH